MAALETGAINVGRSEGATSVTITAVNVTNSNLAAALTRAGYVVQKVTDNFGREAVNYVKTVNVQ